MTKTIGILTSGGDCAGLNAALRAVTIRAVKGYGWKVIGIENGSLGLLQDPPAVRELGLELASGEMLRLGGTVLGSINKGDPSAQAQAFLAGFKKLNLDALIVIGGDGSMQIVSDLCRKGGIPMVGIPKTIDNDVAETARAIGFATAQAVVCEALDRLAPTAASHQRVMIMEVMGRDTGHLALSAGIAGGADVIVIPEIPYTLEGVAERLLEVRREGRTSALVVVSEGCQTICGESLTRVRYGGEVRYGGIGEYLAAKISDMTDAETRVTVLGHVQRGGMPTINDRLTASAFGVYAVDLIANNKTDRVVVWKAGDVTDVALEDVAGITRRVDVAGSMVRTARGLGIYVGE
jgi:ATP-dependent phosphofructokinase / diphosphate-dependent phosphofructokinase